MPDDRRGDRAAAGARGCRGARAAVSWSPSVRWEKAVPLAMPAGRRYAPRPSAGALSAARPLPRPDRTASGVDCYPASSRSGALASSRSIVQSRRDAEQGRAPVGRDAIRPIRRRDGPDVEAARIRMGSRSKSIARPAWPGPRRARRRGPVRAASGLPPGRPARIEAEQRPLPPRSVAARGNRSDRHAARVRGTKSPGLRRPPAVASDRST